MKEIKNCKNIVDKHNKEDYNAYWNIIQIKIFLVKGGEQNFKIVPKKEKAETIYKWNREGGEHNGGLPWHSLWSDGYDLWWAWQPIRWLILKIR